MSALRAAVIGYGLAGRVFHTPLITAADGIEVSAIVTANPERAAQAAEQYPDAVILPDVDALIAASDAYDVAVVASPTPTHASVADRTIRAGLATVVDKPLAVRPAEAEAVIALAEHRGVPLTTFQNRRWDGDFLTVRTLIADGTLGEVHRFESRFEWISNRPRPAWKSGTSGADGGGVAYDLGSHLIDQAVQLFGPVSGFYGELDTHRDGGVNDDDSFIALTHTTGVRSHLSMSSIVAQRGFRFRVLGSETAYTKWGLDQQEPQLAAGLRPGDAGFGVAAEETYGRIGTDGETTAVPTLDGAYAEYYRGVVTALQDGTRMPVDPRDALVAIEIISSLHHSR